MPIKKVRIRIKQPKKRLHLGPVPVPPKTKFKPSTRMIRIKKLKTSRRRAGIDPATGTVTPGALKLARDVKKLHEKEKDQTAFRLKREQAAALRKRNILRAKQLR